MDEFLKEQLNIRYFKAHFIACLPQGGNLPEHKASALRGGMGEMLLKMHCIGNRKCESCLFTEECIVQHTMYSQMTITPPFMGNRDSVGYVIECDDHRTQYTEGEEFEFNLLLFGKTIAHFKSFLRAFIMLGRSGLGKEKTKFQITSVRDSLGTEVFDGRNYINNELEIRMISDYVDSRLKHSAGFQGSEFEIRFLTPVIIKKDREILRDLQIDAVLWSARRRLYILNCFEGTEIAYDSREIFEIPEIIGQDVFPASIRRFSTRSGTSMTFNGLEGSIRIRNIQENLLGLLYAGELIHVGKSTSFGMGEYRVRSMDAVPS